jgi:hypothetical protein
MGTTYSGLDLVRARNDYVWSRRNDGRWDLPAQGSDLAALAKKWEVPYSTLVTICNYERWRAQRRQYGERFEPRRLRRHVGRRDTLVRESAATPTRSVGPWRLTSGENPEKDGSEPKWLPEADPAERRRRFIEQLQIRMTEEEEACERALADFVASCIRSQLQCKR